MWKRLGYFRTGECEFAAELRCHGNFINLQTSDKLVHPETTRPGVLEMRHVAR